MYLNPSFGKVGSKLKQIRKNYGWTLQKACNEVIELSKKLSQENPKFREVKLNPSHLSKIENNEVDTSDYYIGLLCETYQVKISDLYLDADDVSQQRESSKLLHLPPHIRDFVSKPENYYLINMVYNMSQFSDKDKETIREFVRVINI